ncbi:MAG: aldo/keto reductase [Fretibacterium sp.]|nr:aldo/keto reductase [Fretibacterium sp.]
MQTFTLSNGLQVPAIGFGTYKAVQGEDIAVIRMAIDAGYRYFDTASFYGTESFIGEAIRQSSIPRQEFFIASKLWKTEMGYKETRAAFQRTLEALRTDYLDVYMIHWPLPTVNCSDWKELDHETWRAMEELCQEGKIRALGVSNFLPHHLDNIIQRGTVMPVVAQLEFHPGYTQGTAVRYCQDHNIRVQAWSPIGRGRVLTDPLIMELAEKYGATPAQICLRFALQEGVMPLPKASSSERMRENMDCLFFCIEKEDLWRLETMPPVGWSGEHPDRERYFPS